MRRTLALAAIAALGLPLALAGTAQAANHEYVALNDKGLHQALVKKMLGPPWFGKVDKSNVKVDAKGAKPTECITGDGKTVSGTKSAQVAVSFMTFVQSKADHYLDMTENLYQYKSENAAISAWQDFVNKLQGCAGTWTHTYYGNSNKPLGTTKTKITVNFGVTQYKTQQVIVSEDVLLTEGAGSTFSLTDSDQISVWTLNGNAIIETETNKYVPKYKNWVFSYPQMATIEAVNLLAEQRYHLAAYKTL